MRSPGAARPGGRCALAGRLVGSIVAVVVLSACAADDRAVPPPTTVAPFVLGSPVMANGGRLPIEYTCDGASVNPPLAWTGAPAGTVGFAVVMHHVPDSGPEHWYWVVHGLAATVDHLDAAATPPGTLGTNSVDGRATYAPPCSQGPGDKTYVFTVYALTQQPHFAAATRVTRQVLLDAIAGRVIGEATMQATYARAVTGAAGSPPTGPTGPRGAAR